MKTIIHIQNTNTWKNVILIFIAILFSFKETIAQDSLSVTEKLAVTAKVWGFLKYYHPNVADGKYQWDEELFEILPKVRGASSNEELSQVFLNWIENLGKVKECKKCVRYSDKKYFNKNFDLEWINNKQVLTQPLSERLKFIEQNRHQGKKYYAASNKKIKNIKIINEKEYKGFEWTDENLRLLSLFRYWNIIEYFFPYKYQTEIDWDDILSHMIPKFLYPKSELEFSLAMTELAVSIDDSHTGLYTEKAREYFGKYWFPAMFKLIDEKAIITGFYNDSIARLNDLQIGDIITKVNGKNVQTIFNEKEKYISGSNISIKKNIAQYLIFNDTTESVKIEFIRNSITDTKIIKRYSSQDLNGKGQKSETYKILKQNIGYIDLAVLKIKDVSDTFEKLKSTKAIIIDIRNYPKGTLFSIANFISSTRNDFYKKIYPDLNYPGKFIWEHGNRFGNKNELLYKGKVILLVDERTQSQAEFTAMLLQTGDNVTTIGSQTSGANGDISNITMVGGYQTAFSGIGIFYPDGTETQRKGVKIDIEIKPTIDGITERKDEVLEKAIEFVISHE